MANFKIVTAKAQQTLMDMEIGDYAEFSGHLIMRVMAPLNKARKFIALETTNLAWEFSGTESLTDFKCKLLPKGSQVLFTI